MKKKIIWAIVVIVILFSMFAFIGSSDDSSEPVVKPATTVEEEVTEDQAAEEAKDVAEVQGQESSKEENTNPVVEETTDTSEYMKVGETYTSNLGMKMTPLEIGRTSAPAPGGQYLEYFIYVLAEIENGSEDVIDVYQDTTIYIDDYQYESVCMSQIEIGDVVGNATHIDLNPGRKCKYIFYTTIPEAAFNADKVEFAVYGLPALFKDNGEWLYGESSDDNMATESTASSSDGIGNPVIDANPDRYIPEGITGELDVIDGTFYSNKPIIDHVAVHNIVPGEYLIVGGGNAVLTITNDYKASLKFVSNEADFEDADMKEMVITDSALSYQVYGNGTGYVISFYEGGIYLYTDYPDDENDWAEGFYELLN